MAYDVPQPPTLHLTILPLPSNCTQDYNVNNGKVCFSTNNPTPIQLPPLPSHSSPTFHSPIPLPSNCPLPSNSSPTLTPLPSPQHHSLHLSILPLPSNCTQDYDVNNGKVCFSMNNPAPIQLPPSHPILLPLSIPSHSIPLLPSCHPNCLNCFYCLGRCDYSYHPDGCAEQAECPLA